MKIRTIFILLMFGLVGPVWAGSYGDLRKAAYKLDHAAKEFYDRAHYRYGYSDLTYQAKDLTKATHRFCSDVERGVSLHRLERRFSRLQARYNDVRYKLSHHSDDYEYGHGYGHGKLGFKRVSKWLGRLDRALYYERKSYAKHHSRQRHDAHYYANNNYSNERRRSNRRIRRND